MSESTQATEVLPVVPIIDAAGVTWGLIATRTRGNQAIIDGVVDHATSSLVGMLYLKPRIYIEDDQRRWSFKSSPSDVWTEAPAGDPRKALVPSRPRPPESSNNTVLTSPAGTIVDSVGTVWTLHVSAQAGFVLFINGAVSPTPRAVKVLLYWLGVIYQQDTEGSWFAYASGLWVASFDPRPAALVESVSGASLDSTTGTIVDANLSVWTIRVAPDGTQCVAKDGLISRDTANTVLLLYYSHGVFEKNASGAWGFWSGQAWVYSADPRPVATAPTPIAPSVPVPAPVPVVPAPPPPVTPAPVPPPVSLPAPVPVPVYFPSARGGLLLPAGYLRTSGSQIIDAGNNPVRIASIGWYGTDGPAGWALQGLYAASYRTILDSIRGAGFNCVRIPWSNVNLDAKPLNTGPSGTIEANPGFGDLTTIQIFQAVVNYAGQIGLKVIFDHHTDDGNGGQQPNGLWIDSGPGTTGWDGYGAGQGNPGTVNAAKFQADWVRFAQTFAGNPTVIGFDLDNEPHGVDWGGGGPADIHKMFTDVGNAIHAVNPDVLIICEPSQDYLGATPEGNVSLATILDLPVSLNVPNKVVYSVHEYPAEIAGTSALSAADFIARMNRAWGSVVRNNVAPVWIGEMGSNMQSADSQLWAQTLLDYMNGRHGAEGGPTFVGTQQPVGGSWWNIGWEGGATGTGAGGANPDGIQDAWGLGNYRAAQIAVTDRMLFRLPRAN